MTLALYGKSRKRQGGLLLAAFLAVITACLAGVAMVASAFAENIVISDSSGQCDGAGFMYHFLIGGSSDAANPDEVLTIGYQYDGAGPTLFTTAVQNDGGNPNRDWFKTIPFNGHTSITIVSAVGEDGSAWAGNGTELHTSAECGLSPSGTLIVVKNGLNIPLLSGNANGSVSPAINGDGAWTAPMAGGHETFANTPNGTYQVLETNSPAPAPGGAIVLVGYKEATSPTACSLNKSEYTDDGQVTVNSNTQVVCVLNEFVQSGVFGVDTLVTKVAKNAVTSTNDPAAVQWVILLQNNSSPLSWPLDVGILDNATVVGAPSFIDNNNIPTMDPSCAGVVDGTVLTPEKVCFLPGSTSVAITVRPTTIPTRTCAPQTFSNQVTARAREVILGVPQTYTPTITTPNPASTIVLNALSPTDPSCINTGTVIVKKVVSGNASNPADLFGGDVDGSAGGDQSFTDLAANLINGKVYTNEPAGNYTVLESALNGYTLLGYSVGSWNGETASCLNSPVAGTPRSASQSLAANGTVVFCIHNQKTAALPTFSKAVGPDQDPNTGGMQAYDNTYAYFQVTINNNVANAVAQDNVIVSDAGAELVSTSGSGSCLKLGGGALPTTGPWDCDQIGAGQTLTLNLRVPLSSISSNVCIERRVDNTAAVTLVSVTGTPLAVTAGASASATVTAPSRADASCLSIDKSFVDTNTWNIDIFNTGPSTTVHVSDTYQDQFENEVISSVDGCTETITSAGMGFYCSVTATGGTPQTPAKTTLTVHTSPTVAAHSCEGANAANHVSLRWPNGTSAEVDSDTAQGTQPSDQGDCTVVIELCKRWEISVGEEVVNGQEGFEFTVGSNSNVVIDPVNEDGETACIRLTVSLDEFGQLGLPISEDGLVGQVGLPGFNTPVHSVNGGSSVSGASLLLSLEACQQTESFAGIIQGLLASIQALVTPGAQGEPDCTVLFVNNDNNDLLPTGNIQVEKYLDINGDGDANDAGEGPIPGWEMTTTCEESIPGADVQDTNASGVVVIPGLLSGDDCTVTEELPATWQVTRVTVNNANFGANTSADVTVPDNGATSYVRFYNRQLGGIAAHKTTVNVLNGIETVNTNDDDGWTITVKSALCGIDLALDTDANGNAVFSGLPLCTDYVIAEVLASGEPGYSPVGPASVSGRTPTVGGNTQVNFTNETRSTTPPCPNCTPGTQTVPTPTPTPPVATATPCVGCGPGQQNAPTPIPSPTITSGTTPPVTAIAGEKTPGPGQTPIAPSTGEGGFGGGPGGLNLLLILGGLGAVAGGITFMAMGRKNRS